MYLGGTITGLKISFKQLVINVFLIEFRKIERVLLYS